MSVPLSTYFLKLRGEGGISVDIILCLHCHIHDTDVRQYFKEYFALFRIFPPNPKVLDNKGTSSFQTCGENFK